MHTIGKVIFLGLLVAPVGDLVSQEYSSRGNLSAEANWTALNNLIGRNKGEIEVLRIDMEAMKGCSAKGMLYAPDSSNKDANGCVAITMPDPASLEIKTYTEKLCTRSGQHTIISACPADERLLGCGGGPGDQDESHEYWVLMPDFANNRCIGYVGQPRCFDTGWSQAMVTSVCYKP